MRRSVSVVDVLSLWLEKYISFLQANEKNVRISALEENEIKVFLISASPKDAEKIYKALEYRLVVRAPRNS